jgi:hypothetical protein
VGRALLRDLNEDLSSIVKEDCELMRIGEFFSRAGVYVDGDDVNRGDDLVGMARVLLDTNVIIDLMGRGLPTNSG